MSKNDIAYALVQSLYDSGDLSHDQANPILEALDEVEQQAVENDNLRSALQSVMDAIEDRYEEFAATREEQRNFEAERDCLVITLTTPTLRAIRAARAGGE